MIKFFKNNIHLILVLLLAFPAVLALLHKGFYGASDDLHIAWLFEMDKIIKLGQIPPRFVPDLSFGFGYPLFNFVFPLPFYLGEIFHFTGFSLVDGIKIVFAISLIGSGLAMYILLKEIISKELSLVGSLIYIYTPYRSTDVYIRGAIGEALSFVFLPILVYSVIKIYKDCKIKSGIQYKNISILGLSLGALILTHDIVSYMFFPFLLLLILVFVLTIKGSKKVFILNSLVGIFLGLLLSIYFWLPAIIESTLMAYGTVFDFKDHFPAIKQLITPYFGYGASVPGPYDGMSFFMGALNIALIISGSILTLFFWRRISKIGKIVILWAFGVLLISLFMMNHRSTPFWNILPFVPYFQFPWRFLTLTTFTSILFLIPLMSFENKFVKWVIPGVLVVLVLVLNVGYFKPHDFLERDDSYYIDRYIPTPEPSKEYLKLEEEYLRLPKGALMRPKMVYPIIFSGQEVSYKVINTNGIYSKIGLSLKEDQVISYNKYYFPGWYAKIDGREVEVVGGKPFGQVSVRVPKGEHVLEFNFREVPYKVVLDLVSVSALALSLVFAFKSKKNNV